MSKRLKALITLLLAVSLALSFSTGCATASETSSGSEPGLEVVEEAWQIIFEEYVEKDKLDTGKFKEAAIRGMIEALDDPYSSYLSPQTYQLSTSGLEGKFEGIGAYVGIRDEQLIIISPIPNSPAARAGIMAGDIILAVEDNPTSEMSLEEAVLRIRGTVGTPVKLLILHLGETEPEEIEIIRASIEIPSVVLEMREDIAYIRIYSFSERTGKELSEILDDINEEETDGIILDLRSNPGGLLGAVVDVTSHFIQEGIVVYVVDNRGGKEELSVEPQDITTSLPIVALSDNFSASGSEVLIGALQDHGRATIAGTKTFGKGSVNTLNHLKDGSGLYITTARWLTPNGRLIEGEGIEPDYILELEGEDVIQWAIDYLKSNEG
ncbi:S41 family peptidase [Chloroflexota bacterium]